MSPAEDTARTAMRAYADRVQPPPVAAVIARAEQLHVASRRHGTGRPRSRRHLVLAAASAAATAVVLAVAADRVPDRGGSVGTQPGAHPAIASSTPGELRPGCPPGLPVLDRPEAVKGKPSQPLTARAGERLTLTALIRYPEPLPVDFTIHLIPPGGNDNRDTAVARTPRLRLAPGQLRATLVLQIPSHLEPGTYGLLGDAWWTGYSSCGIHKPTRSPGSIWAILGSVVIT